MDLNTARAILTAIAFVTFLGIVWWAYHRKSRSMFDEAAQLPFMDNAADNAADKALANPLHAPVDSASARQRRQRR
jgi:cytochrome c oxidase cbb3-type subunit 4